MIILLIESIISIRRKSLNVNPPPLKLADGF
jgi:hypothetical protein